MQPDAFHCLIFDLKTSRLSLGGPPTVIIVHHLPLSVSQYGKHGTLPVAIDTNLLLSLCVHCGVSVLKELFIGIVIKMAYVGKSIIGLAERRR